MRISTFNLCLSPWSRFCVRPWPTLNSARSMPTGPTARRAFLLTKKEQKEWEKISTDTEAKEFIDLFWARRNPNPDTSFNTFKAEFDAKVRYAEENFSYPGHSGATTDRAKVLILMGRPEGVQNKGPDQAVPGSGFGRRRHRRGPGKLADLVLQPGRTARGLQGQGLPALLHVLRGKDRFQQLQSRSLGPGVLHGFGGPDRCSGGLSPPP